MSELNAAFWRWFGKSVLRDSDGPTVMWHATTRRIVKFSTAKCGFGCHFGDRAQAESVVHDLDRPEKAIYIPVYLRVENPLRLQDPNEWTAQNVAQQIPHVLGPDAWKMPFGDIREALERHGYDAVVYLNRYEGLFPELDIDSERRRRMDIPTRLRRSPFWPLTSDAEFKKASRARLADSYIVWHPEQIKAVDNDGTWDADDPDIRSNPSVSMREALTDYLTDKHVPPEYRRFLAQALEAVKDLVKAMRLHKPRAAFVIPMEHEDAVARYVNGTSDHPVFIFFAEAIKDFEESDMRPTPTEVYMGILVTVVHELCHAYLESLGVSTADFDHDEDAIEELANDWCDGIKSSRDVARELEADADEALKE